MKKRKRPAQIGPPGSTSWPSAVLVALPIVAIALFGLRIRPVNWQVQPPSQMPESIMIAADDEASPLTERILAWSRIGDPTVATQPNPELGLSILHQYPPPSFFVEPPSLEIALPTEDIEVATPAPPRLRDLAQVREWREWLPPLPAAQPFPQPALPRHLIWRWPDGRAVENPPRIDLEEVREKAGGNPPRQPTVLEIAASSELPRFFVRQSCGNPDLDQLALRKLQEYFYGRLPAAPDSPPEASAELRLPPLDSWLRLEIEWRLALPEAN